ncbi:MAG TPA: hypothetical protein VMW08_01045 [Acidimicrobiales bacterium]|nr:hypothetical protein [Acidimicrobiales bacterium]
MADELREVGRKAAQNLALAQAVTAIAYGQAVDIACELEQIASIYGPECVAVVKRELITSGDPDWRRVVSETVTRWSANRAVPASV